MERHPADQVLQNMTDEEAREILEENPVKPVEFKVETTEDSMLVSQKFDPEREEEDEEEIRERLETELEDIHNELEEDEEFDVSVETEFREENGLIVLDITYTDVDKQALKFLSLAHFALQNLTYMKPEWCLPMFEQFGQIASMRQLAKQKLNDKTPDYIA